MRGVVYAAPICLTLWALIIYGAWQLWPVFF